MRSLIEKSPEGKRRRGPVLALATVVALLCSMTLFRSDSTESSSSSDDSTEVTPNDLEGFSDFQLLELGRRMRESVRGAIERLGNVPDIDTSMPKLHEESSEPESSDEQVELKPFA